MVVIDGAVIGMVDLSESVVLSQFEEEGDVFQQMGLVVFDRQQVVSPLLPNLSGNLRLRANRAYG